MIEVRLFATLREGRGKILFLEAGELETAGELLRKLDIAPSDVAILLINGFHSKSEDKIKEGDLISLFPPVGGG